MAAVFLYGFVHEAEDLIASVGTEESDAVLLEIGEPFEDGRSREMPTAMNDALAFITYPLDRTIYMFLKDIYHPTHLTWSHTLSMFKIITDIFEDPRAPKRSTTNHHGIYPILLEALFGALFLDSDFETTRLVILSLYEPLFQSIIVKAKKDLGEIFKSPKSRLQEKLQALNREIPSYEVIDITGRDHEKVFKVLCTFEKHHTIAEGTTKKRAEQRAAELMLEKI